MEPWFIYMVPGLDHPPHPQFAVNRLVNARVAKMHAVRCTVVMSTLQGHMDCAWVQDCIALAGHSRTASLAGLNAHPYIQQTLLSRVTRLGLERHCFYCASRSPSTSPKGGRVASGKSLVKPNHTPYCMQDWRPHNLHSEFVRLNSLQRKPV